MPILYGAVIGGKLYQINTVTGEEIVVGDGVNRNYVGIDIDSAGNLYASALDGNVYKFSVATGALLRTYAIGTGAATRGISVDATNGCIYVADRNSAVLRRVDLSTGAVTSAGSTGNATDVQYSDAIGFAIVDADNYTLWRGASLASMSGVYLEGPLQGVAMKDASFAWVASGSLLLAVTAGAYTAYDYNASGVSSFWGIAISGDDLYASVTGGKIWKRSSSNVSGSIIAITATNRNWQDICFGGYGVSLYGAETQGFERGYSVEVSRPITWQDTLGFAPVGIPYAPADKDEWIVDAELWVSAAQATALEAAVPPFGVPSSLTICVPNRGGENTFAGLAPATFGSIADAYVDPVVLEWESLGQKGPRLDLYGYRIKFSLSCSSTSNPYSSNPATAPTTTPPAWLLNKFRAHQIQDGSVEARVIGPNGKWTGNTNPIKSGRRRDLNFNLDHLSPAQMDELVAFYRGIRSNEFYLWTDANPSPNFLPHPFKAVGLSFQRGAGLWWDATLELVRA